MTWPLMQEHVQLGAAIENDRVESYFGETSFEDALEGVCLYDLAGNLCLFVSGDTAEPYANALCAGNKLSVGSCAFSAVLTGDGSLVSVPLVVRGGDHEYVLVDAGGRREVLDGWTYFVHGIEQNGNAPFKDVSIEPAQELVVPLLICGKRVSELIADYTGNQALPARGEVASILFDNVPCVLAHLDGLVQDAFAIFAPLSFGVRLFRSFLSFSYVNPQGSKSLDKLLSSLPWSSLLLEEDKVAVDHGTLASWGILRSDADFIGAHGAE